MMSAMPIREVAVARCLSPNHTLAIILIELNPNGADAASIKLPTNMGQKVSVIAEHMRISASAICIQAANFNTLSRRMLLYINVAMKLKGI